MQLIVGLGNPGHEYDGTRHNVGFMSVDRIAERHKAAGFKQHGNGSIASLSQSKTLLLKPTTYMNLSGVAVLSVSSFYKIPPKDIVVIHDDIDLPIGVLRPKFGGGHAGHNGIRNIIEHIGPDFHRLRIGVGRPDNKIDIINYVVSKFASNELNILGKIFDLVADNILQFTASGDKTVFAQGQLG
ncbi:MAG: aminoacyl-tRNA hydrolase [Holosporales bacterium]|jgi:PTH1 family peptidyl-tRNA hydrolase|nr:aminoacyl-tRNA hydrolase [Holosporales bacterium]